MVWGRSSSLAIMLAGTAHEGFSKTAQKLLKVTGGVRGCPWVSVGVRASVSVWSGPGRVSTV